MLGHKLLIYNPLCYHTMFGVVTTVRIVCKCLACDNASCLGICELDYMCNAAKFFIHGREIRIIIGPKVFAVATNEIGTGDLCAVE